MIRDLTVLAITSYYLYKVNSFQVTQRLKSIEDGERETHVHLFEFSSVILSVLPCQYFKSFLSVKHKSCLHYLRVLMLYKQWQDLTVEIEEISTLLDGEIEFEEVRIKHISDKNTISVSFTESPLNENRYKDMKKSNRVSKALENLDGERV